MTSVALLSSNEMSSNSPVVGIGVTFPEQSWAVGKSIPHENSSPPSLYPSISSSSSPAESPLCMTPPPDETGCFNIRFEGESLLLDLLQGDSNLIFGGCSC